MPFANFLRGRGTGSSNGPPKYIMVSWIDWNDNPKKSKRTFMLQLLNHEAETYRFILDTAVEVKGERNFEDFVFTGARQKCLKLGKTRSEEVLFLDTEDGLWTSSRNPYRHYKRVNR
jgi:hypothetical protein